MRALKIFAAVVASAIVAFVVVGLARGHSWHVEVSADINAPPARVFAVVEDLTTWRSWMGYDALDPDAAWDYGQTGARQQAGGAGGAGGAAAGGAAPTSGREALLADWNKTHGDASGGASEPDGAAWMAWSGPRLGHGRLTVVDADAPRQLRFVERIESDDVNARGSISLAPNASGTRVTYVEDGDLAPVFGGFAKDFASEQRSSQVKSALASLANAVR
jgi:uncharacterized protein YndB with AHSA1/START domain